MWSDTWSKKSEQILAVALTGSLAVIAGAVGLHLRSPEEFWGWVAGAFVGGFPAALCGAFVWFKTRPSHVPDEFALAEVHRIEALGYYKKGMEIWLKLAGTTLTFELVAKLVPVNKKASCKALRFGTQPSWVIGEAVQIWVFGVETLLTEQLMAKDRPRREFSEPTSEKFTYTCTIAATTDVLEDGHEFLQSVGSVEVWADAQGWKLEVRRDDDDDVGYTVQPVKRGLQRCKLGGPQPQGTRLKWTLRKTASNLVPAQAGR